MFLVFCFFKLKFKNNKFWNRKLKFWAGLLPPPHERGGVAQA